MWGYVSPHLTTFCHFEPSGGIIANEFLTQYKNQLTLKTSIKHISNRIYDYCCSFLNEVWEREEIQEDWKNTKERLHFCL